MRCGESTALGQVPATESLLGAMALSVRTNVSTVQLEEGAGVILLCHFRPLQ